MFQMIMTVAAIGLGIVLAVASAPYIGDIFTGSSKRGHASTLINQGQQISSSAAMYRNQNVQSVLDAVSSETDPNTAAVQELVDEGYLSSMPTLSGNLFATSDGSANPWQMSDSGYAFVDNVHANICDAVNEEAGIENPDAAGDGEGGTKVTADFDGNGGIEDGDGNSLNYGCATDSGGTSNLQFRYTW